MRRLAQLPRSSRQMVLCLVLIWLLPLTDAPAAGLEEQTRRALERAFRWLAAFPEEDLRYDAAVALCQIRQAMRHSELEKAWQRARDLAIRDEDHPQGRLLGVDFVPAAEALRKWKPPAPGQPRVNTNLPLNEALWCDRYPLRSEVLEYLSGPMRDGGGYHSTHALWALIIARRNGCLSEQEFRKKAGPIQKELLSAQAEKLSPDASSVDLFAERALFLFLSGRKQPAEGWLRLLLSPQNPDGSFGKLPPGASAYLACHATLVSCWFLSAWLSEKSVPAAYGR